MSQTDPNDVRSAAQLILTNARQGNNAYMQYDMSKWLGGKILSSFFKFDFVPARAHSINLITEDFLAGYMQDGRMSVVRRFFCLFVTFDLVFVSLLWLICIVVRISNAISFKTTIL